MYINLPGRIVDYDASVQTASVRICVDSIHDTSSSVEEVTAGTVLLDVPVHTPYGGGWAITMPIKEGDTCVLFFSQTGYDHWFLEDKDSGGTFLGDPEPHLRRRFCQEDGYALVGINTIPRAINSYTTNGSQWRNSDTTQHIHLKDDLSIQIDSPTKVVINAPLVEVNSPTIAVTAGTSVTVTSPISTFNGDVAVTGSVVASGAMSGPSGTFGGKSVEAHTHTITGGSSSGKTSSPD